MDNLETTLLELETISNEIKELELASKPENNLNPHESDCPEVKPVEKKSLKDRYSINYSRWNNIDENIIEKERNIKLIKPAVEAAEKFDFDALIESKQYQKALEIAIKEGKEEWKIYLQKLLSVKPEYSWRKDFEEIELITSHITYEAPEKYLVLELCSVLMKHEANIWFFTEKGYLSYWVNKSFNCGDTADILESYLLILIASSKRIDSLYKIRFRVNDAINLLKDPLTDSYTCLLASNFLILCLDHPRLKDLILQDDLKYSIEKMKSIKSTAIANEVSFMNLNCEAYEELLLHCIKQNVKTPYLSLLLYIVKESKKSLGQSILLELSSKESNALSIYDWIESEAINDDSMMEVCLACLNNMASVQKVPISTQMQEAVMRAVKQSKFQELLPLALSVLSKHRIEFEKEELLVFVRYEPLVTYKRVWTSALYTVIAYHLTKDVSIAIPLLQAGIFIRKLVESIKDASISANTLSNASFIIGILAKHDEFCKSAIAMDAMETLISLLKSKKSPRSLIENMSIAIARIGSIECNKIRLRELKGIEVLHAANILMNKA